MTSKNIVRILAAVVDTRHLTLYKEDGSTIVIPQGNPMLRRIIEQATPQLVEKRWADVELEIPPENSYDDFQKKSGGLVRFFKVAKEKLKNLFTPVPEMVLGEVPMVEAERIMSPTSPPTVKTKDGDHVAVEVQTKHEQTMVAVNDIIAHATPVSSEDFHERDVAQQGRIAEDDGSTIAHHGNNSESDTIIAVVDNKVIPGMEKIKTQFGRAVAMGSTIGVENFLRRLAAVVDNRGHSVEDLLKFLERADLPIADDGTILIYKLLRRKSKDGDDSGTKNFYVDCYSGNVEQFVGAFVCMDPSLVDPNRSRDCSNGLHVARRGYLASFSGDVCVLAKLAPEDVIAVPQYDANKMRVCGYHIIAELNLAQFTAVKSNKPITFDEAGRTLLAKAIAGDHIRRTHEVRVTGAKGSSVRTTEISPVVAEPAESAPETIPLTMVDVVVAAPPVVEALSDPAAFAQDKPTDPKEVLQVIEQVTTKVTLSRKEQAKEMYDAWVAAVDHQEKIGRLHALTLFKKSTKKSWDVLGIPDPAVEKQAPPTPVVKQAALKGKDFRRKTKKIAQQKAKLTKATPIKLEIIPAVLPVPTPAPSEGSPRQRIEKLMTIGLDQPGIAASVLKIKKAAKKSWEALGVSEADSQQILKLTGAK